MRDYSLIKFLLVGIINTCIGLTIMYTCLSFFHFSYWTSTLVGNIVGAACSYILNKKFTFKSKTPLLTSTIRFTIVIITCYFLSYKVSLQIIEWILNRIHFVNKEYFEELAILLGACLYTITNYLGQRYFVFKNNQ